MSKHDPMLRYNHSPQWFIGGLATTGALLTGYLSMAPLLGTSPLCPTEGCRQVLNSSYAVVFGLPLAWLGFAAYITLAFLALLPLGNPPQESGARARNGLLLILSSAMALVSVYLMYLLWFELHEVCLYCLASALITFSLLAATILIQRWQNQGSVVAKGVTALAIAVVMTIGISTGNPATAADAGFTGPEVISVSSTTAINLAKHLKQTGAKMYGAYWCPHCYDQKVLFGQPALSELTYIECDPQGENGQPKLCKTAKITGYPTWEINKTLYPGTHTLQELAELSGYPDPQTRQVLPSSPALSLPLP